jgi:hypothetical protein
MCCLLLLPAADDDGDTLHMILGYWCACGLMPGRRLEASMVQQQQ